MKKAKQILAIIGIVLLVLLYGVTIFAAIFDNTATMKYLAASIAATVLIPVTLWLLMRMIELSERNKNKDEKTNK